MNYGISCDPGSKNASPAVWCRRLKCGACTCNSTGKRHSRSWPESAIQNRPQRRGGNRSGAACAAPAFSCPSCAAFATLSARLAPAHAPHRRAFRPAHRATPKTAPRFLARRVFTKFMPAAFVPGWCAGRSSPQNAGRRERETRDLLPGRMQCETGRSEEGQPIRRNAVPHRRFLVPSCAALQCRRPASPARTAPAGFSSGTPGFTPKDARAFLLGGCSQVMPAVFVPRRAFSPAKMRGAERETRDRLRRGAM